MDQIYYYALNCPICHEDGELVIAKTEDGSLVMVCLECGIGFRSEHDTDNADKSSDFLGVALSPPTAEEIRSFGWAQFMKHTVKGRFP